MIMNRPHSDAMQPISTLYRPIGRNISCRCCSSCELLHKMHNFKYT